MELTKEQLESLGKLADCADNINELLELSKYVTEIKDFHEYRLAKRMVIKTWRAWVVGLAGLIGTVLILKAYAKAVVSWFLS